MGFDIDSDVSGSWANDIQNIEANAKSSEVTDADIQNQLQALNNKAGLTSENGFTRDADGTWKLKGEPLGDVGALDSASLLEVFNKAGFDGAEIESITGTAANPEINVPKRVKADAAKRGAAASPPQAQAVETALSNELGGASPDADPVKTEAAWTKLKQKMIDGAGDLGKSLVKYSIIFGATYLGLTAIANAKTACYAVYGDNKQKLPNIADAASCSYLDSTSKSLNSSVVTACVQPCLTYISGSYPANNTPTVPQIPISALSGSSCNCVVPSDPSKPVVDNVSVSYIKYSAFDVFGDILNSAGMFINGLANDILKLASAIPGAIADIGKILMYVGIAAAVVAVLVGLGFLGKKLHDSAQRRKMQQGIKGGSNGRHRFKEWKRLREQIKKKTPLTHLAFEHVLM
jgi:hypothetical protein